MERYFVAGHDAVRRKRNQVDIIELVGAIIVFHFIINEDLLHTLGVYTKSVRARKCWHCPFENYCFVNSFYGSYICQETTIDTVNRLIAF